MVVIVTYERCVKGLCESVTLTLHDLTRAREKPYLGPARVRQFTSSLDTRGGSCVKAYVPYSHSAL